MKITPYDKKKLLTRNQLHYALVVTIKLKVLKVLSVQPAFSKLLQNFTYWNFLLTDSLTYLPMPSDRYNSITAKAMSLIFLLLDIA